MQQVKNLNIEKEGENIDIHRILWFNFEIL
jgi:hypothetical protein